MFYRYSSFWGRDKWNASSPNLQSTLSVTEDGPCVQKLPSIACLCLSTQLYEAVLLYNYCMDKVFTEAVFMQLCFTSVRFPAVRWSEVWFFSPTERKTFIFTPCWTELMFDFLLELLKNVFRWIFRWLIEKENRNPGIKPWTLGTLTSESSWFKKVFLVFTLPADWILSECRIDQPSVLYSVGLSAAAALSVFLCSSAGCDGRWSLLVLMFNSDFTQASTLRCT